MYLSTTGVGSIVTRQSRDTRLSYIFFSNDSKAVIKREGYI